MASSGRSSIRGRVSRREAGQGFADRGAELVLACRGREIAARALDDAADGVGRAPQSARESVGVIERDEDVIDVVHPLQQRFAMRQLALTDNVEDVAAQLADGLTEAVEICRVLDLQR